MSTSAISPVSSIDFDSPSATVAQQSVFNSLLNQLQQAVGSGDLTATATLLSAIDALSPSAASGNTPLATFLTSLGTAVNDGSVTEAQEALNSYQSATPAPATPAVASADTSAIAAQIAAGLIQSQIQLNLVTTLLAENSTLSGGSSSGSASSSAAASSVEQLLGILNAAYGTGDSSSAADAASEPSSASASSTSSSGSSASGTGSSIPSAASSSTSSSTPYDALVSSIQASLAGGDGTLTPALAYLQASGNFVNTSV